jgi:purine-binding chemotaxis protein CheW
MGSQEAIVSSNPSDQRKNPAQIGEYLTFFIAEVEYAVSLNYVREVIPYDTVTRVPAMPETVRGVTNLRGSVVPVIDLSCKFGLPQIEISPRTCIVLVETPFAGNNMLLGLLTEEVGQVLAIDRNDLLAPPSFGTPVHTDYLEGMLPLGKKFALALDISRVLSQEEIMSSTKAKAPQAAPTADETVDVVDDGDEVWEIPADGPVEAATAQRVEG